MFVVGLYVLGGRFLSRLGFTLYNYLLVKKYKTLSIITYRTPTERTLGHTTRWPPPRIWVWAPAARPSIAVFSRSGHDHPPDRARKSYHWEQRDASHVCSPCREFCHYDGKLSPGRRHSKNIRSCSSFESRIGRRGMPNTSIPKSQPTLCLPRQ